MCLGATQQGRVLATGGSVLGHERPMRATFWARRLPTVAMRAFGI